MTSQPGRLLHTGNVVIDVVLAVPALPERGGDVLASQSQVSPGGGFSVLAAAARQGMPVVYAGAHGTGPFGDLARAALAREGVEVALPPAPDADTGLVIAMIEADGERTFLTSPGAEAALRAGDLTVVRPGPDDVVYVSGYSLAHPGSRQALAGWLPGLGDRQVVVFDPGPLGAALTAARQARDALRVVLARADWLTCNAREAQALTGLADPVAAAAALAERAVPGRAPAGRAGSRNQIDAGRIRAGASGPGGPGVPGVPGVPGGALVRTGASGCVVCQKGAVPVRVPGFRVKAVDTNGAGDTHTGTFIAALAGGAALADAARTANAAAAVSVTRRGPATAPTAAELARFLLHAPD
jgi:sugar/nucleoside kinase (ribokinase family)